MQRVCRPGNDTSACGCRYVGTYGWMDVCWLLAAVGRLEGGAGDGIGSSSLSEAGGEVEWNATGIRDGPREYKLPVTRGGYFVRPGANRSSQRKGMLTTGTGVVEEQCSTP